jgi:hypothetical protein
MIVRNPIIFPEDPVLSLNFDSINTCDTDNIELHIDGRDFIKEEGKIYYSLDFELPNGFLIPHVRELNINIYEKKYDKIFTICPHTVKIRNKVLGKELYQYTYYPSPYSWTTINEKIYDVIYVGGGSDYFLDDRIKKYNYLVVNRYNEIYTNVYNVTFREKLDLISKSKVAIVHNIIRADFFDYRIGEEFIKTSDFLGYPAITQHKSRVIEAARCKSLILCKEDGFNIIEDFLTPNIDFIYFNEYNFTEVLDDVLLNYEKYQFIIENAFNKVENFYNIKNFYEDYIKK